MNDIARHNFFLFMSQTVIPRKCLQVVEEVTGEPKTSTPIIYDGKNEDLVFQFLVRRIDGCADE